MSSAPTSFAGALAPFNFARWIEDNAQYLKPPVGNKLVFREPGIVVQVVGGPNQRVDFHDDPVQEFFYQLKGDIILKIEDRGQIIDIPIKEGEVFLLPPHVPHSPQRPMPGSVGLVVEGTRRADDIDAFQWYCFNCGTMVHRVTLSITDIVKDLPPLYQAFYADPVARTCKQCGTVHPGKEPPPGWVEMPSAAA